MTVLADTSMFIAREAGRPLLGEPPSDLSVSAITIGELRLGVLMAGDLETRKTRLATLEIAMLFDALDVDNRVTEAWARLIADLKLDGRRMEINDSWIAATAIAHDMPVVTQDGDFSDIPGLEVIAL